MANLYSQHTYDADLALKASAAVTATAEGTLILDVGVGHVIGSVIIDVTAMDIASNDESYEVILQGSSDATFGTAANVTSLCSVTIGDKVATRLASGVFQVGTDDTIGRYTLHCANERNGTTYRYLRIKTVVVGTTPSITYSAWLAKE